ncbi:MAG: DinB family protein [Ignavibacteria bacterium]|nr:DinB family protein [Ignavibacteria bacterium]MBT8383773.1 DinB family protein [Ignavibacteria bacterium]MBT8391778.1 DinB family protein [Ignavibacteria bacterium]NNJ52342.1 DinB family protein [Ignavibacteriaceae bacterium]NNL21075.1 DinB family protein [Ignavibacteriaceae bacterium]
MIEKLKTVIDRLQAHIDSIPQEFLKYPEGELNRKFAPEKWSKKEILGHLIDSAVNNHMRFIKAQYLPSPVLIDSYAQNDWVKIQNYNEIETSELIKLWKVFNVHIINIMNNTPEENLNIELKAEDPFENTDTLFLLMKDYVDHMDHHLNKIFN